jgi:phosphonate transport system permease protein
MDKQSIARVKSWGRILVGLGLLIFFIYSYQAIMDLEEMAHPARQKSIGRILTALSQPNLFEYEYKIRETPITLENDCQNSRDFTQTARVSQRKMIFDLKCDPGRAATFTIHGSGFQPNTPGYIVMQSNIPGNEGRKFWVSDFSTDSKGSFSITVMVIPMNLDHISSGRTIAVVEQLSKTFRGFSETSRYTAEKMWETIQISFLATVIGAILAIPFTFFSARSSSGWGRGLNILLQPLLAAIRSIHPLITVILAVVVSGIGPTAGVLAITLFSTAVLIDKFSEYAREHTSLGWLVLLKVHFPGLAFRHFPANFAVATVIGFVGGGGIGFLLQQNINLLNYRDASVALLAIIVIGGGLDLLSRAVWHNIQRTRAFHPFTREKEEIPAQI